MTNPEINFVPDYNKDSIKVIVQQEGQPIYAKKSKEFRVLPGPVGTNPFYLVGSENEGFSGLVIEHAHDSETARDIRMKSALEFAAGFGSVDQFNLRKLNSSEAQRAEYLLTHPEYNPKLGPEPKLEDADNLPLQEGWYLNGRGGNIIYLTGETSRGGAIGVSNGNNPTVLFPGATKNLKRIRDPEEFISEMGREIGWMEAYQKQLSAANKSE